MRFTLGMCIGVLIGLGFAWVIGNVGVGIGGGIIVGAGIGMALEKRNSQASS